MKLSERYSKPKLENACERVLEITSIPSVRNISTFLKNGNTKNDKTLVEKPRGGHGILRGAEYYKRGGGKND